MDLKLHFFFFLHFVSSIKQCIYVYVIAFQTEVVISYDMYLS